MVIYDYPLFTCVVWLVHLSRFLPQLGCLSPHGIFVNSLHAKIPPLGSFVIFLPPPFRAINLCYTKVGFDTETLLPMSAQHPNSLPHTATNCAYLLREWTMLGCCPSPCSNPAILYLKNLLVFLSNCANHVPRKDLAHALHFCSDGLETCPSHRTSDTLNVRRHFLIRLFRSHNHELFYYLF